MAQVLTLSDFFSAPSLAASNSSLSLRCSTSGFVSSLFVEDPEQPSSSSSSISTSSPLPSSPVQEPPAAAETLVGGVNGSDEPLTVTENQTEVVNDLEEEEYDFCNDYEDFGYDELDYEYKLVHGFKNERMNRSKAHVPIRASQSNKREHIKPNKRVKHVYAIKLERPRNRRLLHLGPPRAVYAVQSSAIRKSKEERDLEEAILRSRQDGRLVSNPNASLQTFLDLQNRELTPEDYELLLLLDDTVQKKTVSASTFAGYPQTKLAADLDSDCPVCMCPMSAGETVTTLPCNHQYHTPCIERWLTMSSPNCPLDGLSLIHDH